MGKRTATPRQAYNLARGREKLFQNQLRQRGINPNPQPQIIREVIRQPIVQNTMTNVHPIKVQISLFEKFLGAKIFPIEINKNKEDLNLRELINHILTRLNIHWQKISSNENKINELISYVNSKDKEYAKRFEILEKKIFELKEENTKLKEQGGAQ